MSKQIIVAPIFDPETRAELPPTKFSAGTWVARMISQNSTLNQIGQDKKEDISDDDDSETEKSYFYDSAYHKSIRKKKVPVQAQNNSQHQQVYLASRPGGKIGILNEREKNRSKLVVQANLPLSQNLKVEKFLTAYFEQTKKSEAVTIDIALFKKIAFTSGMPLIIIDLMIYLFGGQSSKHVVDNCRQAINLLRDRVAPIIIRRPKGSIVSRQLSSQTSISGGQLHLFEQTPQLPVKQAKKNIAPLKDLPEEVHSDSSSGSVRQLIQEMELEKSISQLKQELKSIEPNLFQDFVASFKNMSEIDFRKKEKIQRMNSKLAEEDRIDIKLTDYVFTEQSLKKGFKNIFQTDCNVFATLLYMKASNCKDFCRLSLIDFFNLFKSLINENRDIRNQAIFKLLDFKNQGVLEIHQLIQIYQKLPDFTLFKFEIMLQVPYNFQNPACSILRIYKDKNVLLKDGFAAKVTFDRNLFRKVLPNSSLVKGISFALFKLTMPVTTSGSHKIVPPNPFLPYPNEEEFRVAIREIYPLETHQTELSELLTDQQYTQLFKMDGLASKATYDAKKLI